MSDFTIRNLTPDDINQYNALLKYAFQVTEEDLTKAGWEDEKSVMQAKQPVLERADVLGCYDGDQLVSQFAVYPISMNVYGEKMPVGIVTSVSTYPEYSGRGIMRELLVKSLERMRSRKQDVALLYPFSIPLYRKFGWEIISNKLSYTIRDYQIPRRGKTDGYVRRVAWESREYKDVHDRFSATTHGCLYRNTLAWNEYWLWEQEDTLIAVYYRADGTPDGYMVYLIKGDIMYIKEMIYLSREAQNGLWSYIRAHESMIEEVRGNNYISEPVAFDMEDGAIKETIRPYIMGRIVDVEDFLRTYRCSPDADQTVTFSVSDPVLPWNDRTFSVRFHKGRCFPTEGKQQNKVNLSIGTLTTLLLGYKNAGNLRWKEKIMCTERTAGTLDKVLLHEIPCISDYI